MDNENERFSLVKRAQSFTHAGRGAWVFFRSTHNAWLHTAILALTVMLGYFYHISRTDWMMLVFAGGLVFASEAFNTAIEIDMDLTSPEYHPYARDTKDVAAGAVLVNALLAVVIGLCIFGPHIWLLIFK